MPSPRDWFRRRDRDSAAPDADGASRPFSLERAFDFGRRGLAGGDPPWALRLAGEPSAAAAPRDFGFEAAPRDEAPQDLPPNGPIPPPPRRHPVAAPSLAPEPAPPQARWAEPGAAAEELPAFRIGAPGSGWLGKREDGGEADRSAQLRDAFTPTRPKQQGGQFSGRFRQLQRIIAAIEEERAHVVVYGERGSGKTSLANILGASAAEAGYVVSRFACSSALTFEDIFRSLLRRVPASAMAAGLGAANIAGYENFADLLPPGEFGPPELTEVLEKLDNRHLILIIDEYDRLTDVATKNKLAELIKNMSDTAVPVTLLLIGVAEDVEELLGRHPSLQRALVTVPLPLMARREIEGIILAGEAKTGVPFDPAVRRLIAEFACGLPYHAQLMSLFAARSAARRGGQRVEARDLAHAVEHCLDEAEARIKEAFALAVGPAGAGSSFKEVLFAAAATPSDEYGFFSMAELVQTVAAAHPGAVNPLSLQYPLKKLSDPERGAVLRRIARPEGLRYQFVNQRMRHYVLLKRAQLRRPE